MLCVTGALGHWLLIRCYEVAEASAVQPFAYLQLVFASAIGLRGFPRDAENQRRHRRGTCCGCGDIYPLAGTAHHKSSLAALQFLRQPDRPGFPRQTRTVNYHRLHHPHDIVPRFVERDMFNPINGVNGRIARVAVDADPSCAVARDRRCTPPQPARMRGRIPRSVGPGKRCQGSCYSQRQRSDGRPRRATQVSRPSALRCRASPASGRVRQRGFWPRRKIHFRGARSKARVRLALETLPWPDPVPGSRAAYAPLRHRRRILQGKQRHRADQAVAPCRPAALALPGSGSRPDAVETG